MSQHVVATLSVELPCVKVPVTLHSACGAHNLLKVWVTIRSEKEISYRDAHTSPDGHSCPENPVQESESSEKHLSHFKD